MMLLWKNFLPLSFLIVLAQTRETPVLHIHGSGTTNPSKCYWAILEQMQAAAKWPIRMTYRAVGSTTGQQEIINRHHPNRADVDFGSGDIPFTTKQYNELQKHNISVMHIPVLLGAVSFFHSVPNTPQLNLTSCLLARIFTQDITTWDHTDIVAKNPNLKVDKNFPIHVAVRVKGSSSTSSITEYLHGACKDKFPSDLVDSKPDWTKVLTTNRKDCQGSAGMVACIDETPGTIGYMDAGHGVAAGLYEIELQNKDGTLLNSTVASSRNGIAAAESGVYTKLKPTDDFGSVSLLNRPGPNTWPIVQMTYIYVRTNLTYVDGEHKGQGLLFSFLRALFMEEYVGQCRDNYGFTLPSEQVQKFSTDAIDLLESKLDKKTSNWTFEIDTEPYVGSGDHVFSSKRKQIADVKVSALEEMVAEMAKRIETLEKEVGVSSAQAAARTSGSSSDGFFTSQDQTQLTAALVMSSLAFVAWIGYFLWACFARKKTSKQQPEDRDDTDDTGLAATTPPDATV